MTQKLKEWFIDLLGGYTREEIFIQRTLVEEVFKREQELKKKLELIETDLKNSDDNGYLESIARLLTISLENIRQKEIRIIGNTEYELENKIFALSREFKSLVERKNMREWNKSINFLEKTPYQDQFLNKYDFFKTIEWKKEEAIQFEKVRNKNKQQKTAIFYDAENFIQEEGAYRIINSVHRETSNDKIIFNGAYADWGLQKEEYRDIFINNGIALKQSISYQKVNDTFKNASDISLCIDAMEVILKNKELNKIVIVTGDGGFVNLIIKAKEYGINVVVISIRAKLNKVVPQFANKVITIDLEYSALQKLVYYICKKNSTVTSKELHSKIFTNNGIKSFIRKSELLISEVLGSVAKSRNEDIAKEIQSMIYIMPIDGKYEIKNISGNDILILKKF